MKRQNVLTKLLIMSSMLFLLACASPSTPTDEKTQQGQTVQLEQTKIKTQQGYIVQLEQTHEITVFGGQSEIKFLPFDTKNGSLYVRVYRLTLESANLDSFSYVLKKDNKVISRWQGEWEQPEIPDDADGYWWNFIFVNTKGPLTPGIYTLQIKDSVAAVDVRNYPYDEFKITVTK